MPEEIDIKKALCRYRKEEPVEFSDPIFRKLALTEAKEYNIAKQMLDTFEFNRLHHIHQAGLQFYVRPSATGTRFSHSLGAASLAK